MLTTHTILFGSIQSARMVSMSIPKFRGKWNRKPHDPMYSISRSTLFPARCSTSAKTDSQNLASGHRDITPVFTQFSFYISRRSPWSRGGLELSNWPNCTDTLMLLGAVCFDRLDGVDGVDADELNRIWSKEADTVNAVNRSDNALLRVVVFIFYAGEECRPFEVTWWWSDEERKTWMECRLPFFARRIFEMDNWKGNRCEGLHWKNDYQWQTAEPKFKLYL